MADGQVAAAGPPKGIRGAQMTDLLTHGVKP